MSDDTILKLGKLIEGECGRDAIHIAVAPVFAAERLSPGQHIGLIGADHAGRTETPVGIVDPFLQAAVIKGDRFFLFLYPATITSLRHEWTHPAFAQQAANAFDGGEHDPKAAAEKWLRNYAEIFEVSYGRLMAGAKEWLDAGEDSEWITLNFDTPSEAYGDQAKEFWRHYETMTGMTAKDTDRTFFTCSC